VIGAERLMAYFDIKVAIQVSTVKEYGISPLA